MVEVDGHTFEKSERKDKKLKVRYNNKTIHFGNPFYEHFHDRTGIWSNKDHNDPKRRESYRKRHKAIRLKDGSLAYKDKNQPSYWSMNYLW